MNQFHIGVVENRDDPLKLGRCQVRIIGLHTHDKGVLPTSELPWAYPMQPVYSAAISGIGVSPTGIVEGASVVVIFPDAPDNQQPLIIGTLGGIPQSNNVSISGNDLDDRPLLKKVETGELQPMPAAEEDVNEVTSPAPASTTNEPPTTEIPTTPPESWNGNRARAENAIRALLAACDQQGMTTREQKCTVLAIVGGESGWIPQEEAFNYSAERLQTVFPKTFKGQPELAQQYARWKGSRKDFFNFVYAPENNGSLVGNTQPDDGGKYYGKGFIQLTGRPNYTRFAQLSGVDILNNPDLLNTDIDLSARVAVAFIKDKTKGVQPGDHPGYFYAAKKAVNKNDPIQPKLGYYEYFYGAASPTDVSVKDAGSVPAPTEGIVSGETVVPSPQVSGTIGFKDPNGKYPLKDYLHEPDTNRLARGVTTGTIVPLKDANRAVAIPKANDQGTFDEPKSPFGARYPFNHVFETESGHVQEFDDTPGKERIHWYHRKGTFTEVDENGTQVHHIVGDSYTIIDRNGCIYITGEGNITVDGNINIFCQSDANIEVAGNTEMKFGGNLNMGVAGNMGIAVGGNFTLWSQGRSSIQTADDLIMRAGDKFGVDATRVDMNSGTTSPITLTPPPSGAPIRKTYEYLTTIASSQTREVFDFETEEEWATPEGQAAKRILENEYPATDVTTQDEARPAGGADAIVPPSCEIIQATQEFTADFRLSENFTLGMMFDKGFNKKHKLVAQNDLSVQDIVCNLSQVCQNILEPALEFLPNGIAGYGTLWNITSGYRQGTSKSQHNKGQAVDIALSHSTPNRKQATFDTITTIEKKLPYDQIILEYRGANENWIHISYNGTGRRKQAFTMLNDTTYPQRGATGFYLL